MLPASFNTNFPQYQVELNVAKWEEANVSPAAVLKYHAGLLWRVYASNFNQFGKQYRVMVQADAAYRGTTQSLNNILRTNQ